MARNKYNSYIKNEIIKQYNSGITQKSLSERFNINKSGICRLIKKFVSTGSVETIHSGGRPRKTSAHEDQMIIREIKKDPFVSSQNIANKLDLNITARTVRDRALKAGMRSRKVAKKPFISPKNRKARIEFAKTHLHWSVEEWRKILFSDESKFNLKGSDSKKISVRRPVNKRLDPRYCKGTVKHGGGNVMVWGCFSLNGVGPRYEISETMDRYLYKNILETVMLPFAIKEMPAGWIFQHDNDPKHTSKHVKSWIQDENINLLKWPAQSPDLKTCGTWWTEK